MPFIASESYLPLPPCASLLAAASCVVCDLCDEHLSYSMAVYTCDNGERTILHPTTYDVCEACFVRYAVSGLGDEGLAQERRIGEGAEEIQ